MRKSRRGSGNSNRQSQAQFNNGNGENAEVEATPPLNEPEGAAKFAPPENASPGPDEPELHESSNNGNGSKNGLEKPPELYVEPSNGNGIEPSGLYAPSANGLELESADTPDYSNNSSANGLELPDYSANSAANGVASPETPAYLSNGANVYPSAAANTGFGRRRRKANSALTNGLNEPHGPPPLLNEYNYNQPDPGSNPQLPEAYGQPGTIPQLPGAVQPYEPAPEVVPPGPNRPWRKTFPLQQYIVPGLLMLALLVGVFIIAYGIGLDRGKRSANDERDAFYQERIARLVAASGPTLAPNPSVTPGTPSGSRTVGAAGTATQTYARIDKIEGDRITVLLLGPNGAPTGVSLVIVTSKTSQVYKSSEAQPTELRPGDNVMVNSEKNGDNYIVRTIVVLPSAS